MEQLKLLQFLVLNMSKRKHYDMDSYLSECKNFQGVSQNMLVEFCLAKPKHSLAFANKRINVHRHINESSRKQLTQNLTIASKTLAVSRKVRTH